MAVKSKAVAPEAEKLAAYCLGRDRVEKLTHPKDITLSSVVAHHLLSHVSFHADHSQY